jgi:hypothetical protein
VIGPLYSAVIPETVVVAVVLVTAGASDGWASARSEMSRAAELEVPHPAATVAHKARVTSSRAVLIRLV